LTFQTFPHMFQPFQVFWQNGTFPYMFIHVPSIFQAMSFPMSLQALWWLGDQGRRSRGGVLRNCGGSWDFFNQRRFFWADWLQPWFKDLGKWWFIVDLYPLKMVIFHSYDSLPEGIFLGVWEIATIIFRFSLRKPSRKKTEIEGQYRYCVFQVPWPNHRLGIIWPCICCRNNH